MQLLFLLFSSYFASLFCLYLNTRYADLKVPFDMIISREPSSIDHVLSVQPDHCYKNLAIQNTWKYCFINYHNLIRVSVSWQITQTPKTKPLILLFYNKNLLIHKSSELQYGNRNPERQKKFQWVSRWSCQVISTTPYSATFKNPSFQFGVGL